MTPPTDDAPPPLPNVAELDYDPVRDSGDIVTDDLIDRHLEGDADPDPTPAGKPEATGDDDVEATSDEEDFDDDDFGPDDDEPGDDELDEAFEDADDDEEEEDDLDDEDADDSLGQEDDDEEDAETGDSIAASLSPEELKEIEADPRLRKRLKQMERTFFRKTSEVAEQARDVESREREWEDFMQEIQTPEGALEFLKEQVLRVPDLVGAAFEAVATEEGAVDFLVEVGLVNGEALQKAVERIEELQADPREKKLHERERELNSRDRREKIRRDREQKRDRRRRVLEIRDDLDRFAGREEIHEDDLPELRRRVATLIRANGDKTGTPDISRDELRQEVKRFGNEVRKRDERLRARMGAKGKKKVSPARKKKRSAGAGRNRVPKSGGVRRKAGSRRQEKDAVPEGVDPLDYAVERAAKKHFSS